MATSPTESFLSDSGSRQQGYSRKQKSLGLLCANFLALYNRDDIESIGLDEAASKLGVERRRIYDIVNVLESVGVLSRKAKNQYSWKGFKAIPKALEVLKEEGIRENFGSAEGTSSVVKFQMMDEDEDEAYSNSNLGTQYSNSTTRSLQSHPNTGSQPEVSNINCKSASASKQDNRREKSLGLLTQNFVKLFLCTNAQLISLDDAAKLLLGDGGHSAILRNASAAKVRRLYDIANVLSSMRLIEKTHQLETRKPAFRWLGFRDTIQAEIANAPEPQTEYKGRTFGTDITNNSSKRGRVDVSNNKEFKEYNKIRVKEEAVEPGFYQNYLEQEVKNGSGSIFFGPFAPTTRVAPLEQKKRMHLHDLQNVSSTYPPHYQNQAVKELFDHYVKAWNSYMFEVAGEKPIE